jgi:hypothetical protein
MVGRETYAPVTSRSQVPGTSGAPHYTPSATPGGVSQSDGTGTPSSPYGSLAAMLGLGGSNTTNPGGGLTDRNMKMAQLGMRMLAPPASPLWQGAPPAQLSTPAIRAISAPIARTGFSKTIQETGELFGQKFKAASISGESKSYADHFEDLIRQKAAHLKISVQEMEKRLREGDADLLSIMLGAPTIGAVYRHWKAGQIEPASSADNRATAVAR